ncbi:MAG: hypothetical protein ACHQ9S_07125 [Candidatus Binatia bacterium]
MSGKRLICCVTLGLWAAGLVCSQAHAVDLHSDLSLLGQVRQGDQSRETEAPTDIYGQIGVNGLYGGASLDTYFRAERDFGLNHTATDFYAGSLRVPGTKPGVEFTLGRQFLSEGPGVAFVADAGKINVDPGGPVGFTIFGGQPRYFEPTFSSESLSQNEQIFGGNVHTTNLKNGRLSVGYFEQHRDGSILRQLVTGAGAHSFTQLPGLPNLYGSVALDAQSQNVKLGTAGADVFLSQPRLLFNFESTYYKPQDHGKFVTADINRREDPSFELFSVSEMLQFRGGLRYTINRTISAYGDYSYQRYEKLLNLVANGHVASVGLLWLPGGDGLEVVRTEYYVIDSGGGNVNGGRLYYESRVYNRILFRTKADVAYYSKENNERDTAVTGMLGLGYVICPGLVWELDFEGNHNKRFNEEFRFGFLIRYNFDYRSDKPVQPRGASAAHNPWESTSGRPVS